jgi:hypothetical protein
LYSSNGKVNEEEMSRACSMNGDKRNAYKLLVGKPEGKRPLGRQVVGGPTILKRS